MYTIRRWLRRTLNNPQIVGLVVVLLTVTLIVWGFGAMLMPVLASIVIAYLLEGFVAKLEARGMRRLFAVIIVFCLFLTAMLAVLIGGVPLIVNQLTELANVLPSKLFQMKTHLLDALSHLPERYPAVFLPEQVGQFNAWIDQQVTQLLTPSSDEMKRLLFSSSPLQGVVGLMTVLVYVVILPILVFFFMKDKSRILQWFTRFLPRERDLLTEVWIEVDAQIGNYIRGKFLEIVVVWFFTYLAFVLLDLRFALLLSVAVGLSVIIPYVGAAVVTLPVALVAYIQFGWGDEFVWVMVAYLVIQALDGNALVPLLFSEVVNLHPIAIIVAILIFGGLWGFWGVFFAIPLATLVQAVMNAWPTGDEDPPPVSDATDAALDVA